MDAEQDALEYWIDAAWLANEQNVPHHGGGRGGGHEGRSVRADRRHRERRPKPSDHSSASSRNNSEEPPARGSSHNNPLPPPSWSASSQEEARQQPDNLTRLQRNIEQLERKIATAAVVLSEAERRALRRKEAKRRHEALAVITRTVSSLQLEEPSELEGLSAHPAAPEGSSAHDGAWRLQLLSAWQGMQAAAARGRAAEQQEQQELQRQEAALPGLAVVLSALAGALTLHGVRRETSSSSEEEASIRGNQSDHGSYLLVCLPAVGRPVQRRLSVLVCRIDGRSECLHEGVHLLRVRVRVRVWVWVGVRVGLGLGLGSGLRLGLGLGSG